MDYNYHRIRAILNILIEKGIITEEEFKNEVKKVRKSEREAMFIESK